MNEVEEPLTETKGTPINYTIQDKEYDDDLSEESVDDLDDVDDVSVNSWLMVKEDKEASDLPSGPCEMSESEEMPSITVASNAPNVYNDSRVTPMTEKDIQRNCYNK